MASKQLGKLRQWAGEVISTKEKTLPSDDFVQLEREVDITRSCLERLQLASSDYHAYITRKFVSEAVPGDDKLMHTEALGLVMVSHGEELGNENSFGRALVSFGRARCRIAALQEAFAVNFADTFISHLNMSLIELEEYSGLKKKFESRRLALDAAITKADKTYKKEKDKREAQDEYEKARLRYEKVCDDVRARMDAIQMSEDIHTGELSNLLDLETKCIEQYLAILKEVRSDWSENIDHGKTPRASSFRRSAPDSAVTKDVDPKSIPSSRFSSYRSHRSVRSTSSISNATERKDGNATDSDTERPPTRPTSRLSRKKSATSEVPSRPQSRQSRKRKDSITTTSTTGPDEDIEVKMPKPRRKSIVSSWGGAVTNVMSRNKNRDKENFAALEDDTALDIGRPRSAMSNRSTRSGKALDEAESPKAPPKKMKALYDFAGSTDELSFKAGDEINVIQEVLDDWWMGEIRGRRGLFPTNYAVIVKEDGRKTPTIKPSRSASTSNIIGLSAISRAVSSLSSEDDESRRTLVDESEGDYTDSNSDGASFSDTRPFDDDFGVHHFGRHTPLNEAVTHRKEIESRGPTPNALEFRAKLSESLSNLRTDFPTSSPINSSGNQGSRLTPPLQEDTSRSSPTKRHPPPPPPPRRLASGMTAPPPPLPARNLTSSRSQSVSSLQPPLSVLMPELLVRKANSDSASPFDSESQSINSFDAVALTSALAKCRTCGGTEFVDDPFGGKNLCANCKRQHDG